MQPPAHTPGLHEESAANFRPRAMRRAIEYIHANLADSVRLEDIAGAVGLSVFHFSRTFRPVTLSVAGKTQPNAIWSYEQPYDEVSAIREGVAFYPNKVDRIETLPA